MCFMGVCMLTYIARHVVPTQAEHGLVNSFVFTKEVSVPAGLRAPL